MEFAILAPALRIQRKKASVLPTYAHCDGGGMQVTCKLAYICGTAVKFAWLPLDCTYLHIYMFFIYIYVFYIHIYTYIYIHICIWRREWQLTPVFLPGESHGQRRLAGYNSWGCKESDITK